MTESGEFFSSFIRVQNCSGFPGSTYAPFRLACDSRDRAGPHLHTHTSYGISGPERHDFPLVIVRHRNDGLRERKQAHESISLLKVLGRASAHDSRVHFDIGVGLGVNILDLVNPWLQFSVLEDGRGVVGRIQGHGWKNK